MYAKTVFTKFWIEFCISRICLVEKMLFYPKGTGGVEGTYNLNVSSIRELTTQGKVEN